MDRNWSGREHAEGCKGKKVDSQTFTIREDRLMIKTASPPDVKFLSSFESLDDPRQQAKVRYPLDEILLLVLCAVLSGADGWVEIATWGKKKLDFEVDPASETTGAGLLVGSAAAPTS